MKKTWNTIGETNHRTRQEYIGNIIGKKVELSIGTIIDK